MTRQRTVILEELRRVTTHPGADEIYEMVRKRLPRISLGTIYRNLEILSENGDIRRLDTGSHLKRFDGRAEHHYHIRCLRCDRLVDAFVDLGADIDRPVREASDFLIIGHQLEFVGICPQCQRPSTERPNTTPPLPPPADPPLRIDKPALAT
jgi:Fur family ferric uptake transcriptional regulator